MPIVLVAILVVSTLALVGMGLRQWRRRRQLTLFAQGSGLRFSPGDPYDLIGRLEAFSLMQSGHSVNASNVMSGYWGRWRLRLFDCHFEVGHGVKRLVRRYCMVAADLPATGASAFVWRDGPTESLAPPLPDAFPLAGPWRATGDVALAERLKGSWTDVEGGPVGIEVAQATAVFAMPGRLSTRRLARYMDAVSVSLSVLAGGEG